MLLTGYLQPLQEMKHAIGATQSTLVKAQKRYDRLRALELRPIQI